MTGKKLEEYEQMCAKIASDKAKLEEEEKSLQALEQKTKEKKKGTDEYADRIHKGKHQQIGTGNR